MSSFTYYVLASRRKLRPDVTKKPYGVVSSHHIGRIRHGEHSQKVSEHSDGSRRHVVVIVYVNVSGFPSFFTIKLRLLLNSQQTLFILQSYASDKRSNMCYVVIESNEVK